MKLRTPAFSSALTTTSRLQTEFVSIRFSSSSCRQTVCCQAGTAQAILFGSSHVPSGDGSSRRFGIDTSMQVGYVYSVIQFPSPVPYIPPWGFISTLKAAPFVAVESAKKTVRLLPAACDLWIAGFSPTGRNQTALYCCRIPSISSSINALFLFRGRCQGQIPTWFNKLDQVPTAFCRVPLTPVMRLGRNGAPRQPLMQTESMTLAFVPPLAAPDTISVIFVRS